MNEGSAHAPGDIVVRPAGPADAEAIAAVRIETWRSAYAGILSQDGLKALDVDVDTARWRRNLAAPTGRRWVRVAYVGTPPGIVGFVTAGIERPQLPAELPVAAVGEICAIYVRPSEQRHGAGRALPGAALGGLRVRGFTRAVLWVLEENAAARRFYEAAGFIPDGDRHVYDFAGAAAPEIRMAIDIA